MVAADAGVGSRNITDDAAGRGNYPAVWREIADSGHEAATRIWGLMELEAGRPRTQIVQTR